jgi:hypothetical protein
MRRTRQVLAIVVVATALFADRGMAAPTMRPDPAPRAAGSLAGRFIDRLSRGFSRSVPVVLPRQARRAVLAVLPVRPSSGDQSFGLSHRPVSPFQFRLPPPPVA